MRKINDYAQQNKSKGIRYNFLRSYPIIPKVEGGGGGGGG
jgi:hypothetical protein